MCITARLRRAGLRRKGLRRWIAGIRHRGPHARIPCRTLVFWCRSRDSRRPTLIQRMSTLVLVLSNLWAKKARSIGLAFAVALAVMTVVTLTVVGSGLENSAAAILKIGKADFTVAQKDVSDILASNLDQHELAEIQGTKGVSSAVGVLVETEKINAANPLFLEIGIPPSELAQFGVTVLAGHPYSPDATNQMMIGWRAAQDFGLSVGDKFHADGTENTIVGIYSTGISFGDLGAMFPLPAVQAYNRVPGAVTLVFVKIAPGYRVSVVEQRIDYEHPELTTIRTATQFGRADRNLVFLQAAATGSTILAVIIGAILVGNTMMLSLFERTREFGLLESHRLDPHKSGVARARRGPGAGGHRRSGRSGFLVPRDGGPPEPAAARGRAPCELHPRGLLARALHGTWHDDPRNFVPGASRRFPGPPSGAKP